MFSRYDNRRILTNSDSIYKEFFRQRGVSFIKQYETPTLHYPSPEDIAGFQINIYQILVDQVRNSNGMPLNFPFLL